MYSPKISEELVPVLYRMAKAKGMPMTKLVDRLIQRAIASERPVDEAREAFPPAVSSIPQADA